MDEKEIIIKFLLDKVSELNQDNKRLNDLLDKLHADCSYYENHWIPKDRDEEKDEDTLTY